MVGAQWVWLVPCGSEQCLAPVTDALQMSVVFCGSPGCVVHAWAPAALSQQYASMVVDARSPLYCTYIYISEQTAKNIGGGVLA